MNCPGLQTALAKLDAGQADHLMAVRLERISRSVAYFAATLDRSAKKGWGLVLLSPDLDTTSAAGRFTAHVLDSASEYERALISVRTRDALAQKNWKSRPRASSSAGRRLFPALSWTGSPGNAPTGGRCGRLRKVSTLMASPKP